MTCLFRFCLVSASAAVSLLIATASTGLAAEAKRVESDDAWVASMTTVHEKFTGERGTFAQFGDSITVSRAFWFGLRYAPKNTSPQMTHPSNPQKYANDYSDQALHKNGFSLRNYLTLMKYAEVIEKVLSKKSAPKDAP